MKNIDATVQYLNWAMVAALAEQNPDCKEVTICCNLERRTSITSYSHRDDPKTSSMTVSLREATILRDLCERRIDDLGHKIEKCAGGLYPAIWTKQINEIMALFQALTGFPLRDPDDTKESS